MMVDVEEDVPSEHSAQIGAYLLGTFEVFLHFAMILSQFSVIFFQLAMNFRINLYIYMRAAQRVHQTEKLRGMHDATVLHT